jgi:replication factor A1
MAIKDIQAKQGNITVEADVIEVGAAREFSKFGKPGRVANARIRDESGECSLSLWNEQVDLVKQGDRIRVTNGWANEWQGQLQLSTGRMGTLEVLGHGSVPVDKPPTKPTAKQEFYTNQPEKADDLTEDVEEEFIDEDEN